MSSNVRPIPILLMVRHLDLGGCERDLAKIAIGLDRRQFTPFVGCFDSKGFRAQELRAANVPIIEFPVRSFASLKTLNIGRQVGRFIADKGIKIVHTFDIPANIFGVPVARFYKVPVVIASDLAFRDLLSNLHRRMMSAVDPLAHKFVVNSTAVGEALQRDEGIAASKIFLSYNGVDVRDFYPAPPEAMPEFLQGSLVIGTLCALRTEKCVDVLIDAFAKVHKSRQDVKLLIVGSGNMLPSLEGRCESLGIRPYCLFQPAVKDAAHWLRMMDVFVLTSRSESFPNALLEAMACGRCVVASRIGGVPELVTDDVNGLTFPPLNVAALAQSLLRVVQENALRDSMAKAAAKTAQENFTIEQAIERMQNFYLSLASNVTDG